MSKHDDLPGMRSPTPAWYTGGTYLPSTTATVSIWSDAAPGDDASGATAATDERSPYAFQEHDE